MNTFLRSTPGRLVAFSFALALIGGGASVHMSEMTSLYVRSLSIFVGIVGCVVALELAVNELEEAAIMASIVLPFLLFMYAVGLGVTAMFYQAGSHGFIALGVASLTVGLWSIVGEKGGPVANAEPALREVTAPAAE